MDLPMQTQEVLVEEPGGGGSEDLEGLIDLVARANDVHVQALPVVRANPCAMHNRPLPGDRPHGLDLLYSTSCHGGKVNPASKAAAATTKLALWDNSSSSTNNNSCSHHRHQAPPPPEPREQGFATSRSDYTPRGFKDAGAADGVARDDYAYSKGVTRGGKAGGGWGRAASPPRGRQHQHQLQLQQKQQYPLHQQGGQHPQQGRDQQRPAPAKLPERLASKDVVLTWLQHGSVPVGQSHFPDIIAPQPTDRLAARRRHNHSTVSE